MKSLTLKINAQDYGFIVEAIKLRTGSMLESFEVQKEEQEKDGVALTSIAHPSNNTSFTVSAEPKKPHWTQTAKGKKIIAARKRRGSK